LTFCFGLVWYGKRVPCTVVGASRSSKAANCSHSVRPFSAPKRRWNASSSWDSASSRPPPLPKIPPTSEAVGEEVGHLPVVRSLRAPERGVLARHLGRVQARLGDVLVDAGDVVQRVVLQPAPARAIEVVAEIELAPVVGLGVRGDRPLLGVHRPVGRRPADEGGELRTARGGAARR
jgi:hypothetical protein